MSKYLISRGSVQDWPVYNRQGWWWHCLETASDGSTYDPEGPFQTSHQTHGGTWYTFDYAVKKHKPTTVIFPDQERTS